MRTINRRLVEAEANEDGAAVRDDRLTSLETKLLNTGSELVSLSAAMVVLYSQLSCDSHLYSHIWAKPSTS